MARSTPQQFVDKWSRNTKNATQYYTQGVQAVTQAPGAAAAAKKNTYVQRVNDRADTWARNVGAVTLQDWQNAAVTVGAARISSGVDKAQAKMNAVAGPLLQAIDTARSAVKQMPNGTQDERIARMVEFSRRMSAFKKR